MKVTTEELTRLASALREDAEQLNDKAAATGEYEPEEGGRLAREAQRLMRRANELDQASASS